MEIKKAIEIIEKHCIPSGYDLVNNGEVCYPIKEALEKAIKALEILESLDSSTMKSIEGLIEKINEQDFIVHDGDHHWYMDAPVIKEKIIKIIREYYEVDE